MTFSWSRIKINSIPLSLESACTYFYSKKDKKSGINKTLKKKSLVGILSRSLQKHPQVSKNIFLQFLRSDSYLYFSAHTNRNKHYSTHRVSSCCILSLILLHGFLVEIIYRVPMTHKILSTCSAQAGTMRLFLGSLGRETIYKIWHNLKIYYRAVFEGSSSICM